MKFVFILAALTFVGTAFAQKHMIEFNPDSVFMGKYSFTTSKSRGRSAEEDKFGFLYVNYAYTVAPNLQAGIQANYVKARFSDSVNESYALLLGGIYNLDTDLKNSLYASAYGGYEWEYYRDPDFENEQSKYLVGKVSVGKRFALTFGGLENLSYSPEVSFTSKNGNSSDADEWEQEFAIKYLQFSVLF